MTDDKFLTTRQAAEYVGSTINSLTSMRSVGSGPRWTRAEDTWHVRYLKSDLDEYLANRSPSDRARAYSASLTRAKREGPHRP